MNKRPAFKSQWVNGHLYTDREYIDASNISGHVDCSHFSDRYGFFTYVFTQTAERHASRVNSCFDDLQEEERQKMAKIQAEKEALIARRRALEEELARKQKELEKRSVQSNKSNEFKNCDLSEEQKTDIIENVFSPIKISDTNEDAYESVPNGIILVGGNKERREKLCIIIAKEILGKEYPENFIKIKNIKNDDSFGDYMLSLKQESKERFDDKHKRTILFMEDFNNFAADINDDSYNPNRNNFLKNYFLDCADYGCLIIATAKDTDSVEDPFIINKKRFGLVIEL